MVKPHQVMEIGENITSSRRKGSKIGDVTAYFRSETCRSGMKAPNLVNKYYTVNWQIYRRSFLSDNIQLQAL